MSYSSISKSELCKIKIDNDCCRMAETYGLLLCSKLLSEDCFSYSTDNKAIADRMAELTASVCGVYADVLTLPTRGGNGAAAKRYTFKIPDSIQKGIICKGFDNTDKILEKDCCVNAFLRGTFLVCGTATDPTKDYHLEFLAGSKRRGDIIAGALARAGIRPHSLTRGERRVVYVKDAEGIINLMTRMGAVYAADRVAETRKVRDCRNNANRRVNCDQANIDRTVSASEQQCAAIKALIAEKGFEGIPPELRETAKMRLENPEMSLRDLSESLSEPISRSGVNHRLKKLIELAGDVKNIKK